MCKRLLDELNGVRILCVLSALSVEVWQSLYVVNGLVLKSKEMRFMNDYWFVKWGFKCYSVASLIKFKCYIERYNK